MFQFAQAVQLSGKSQFPFMVDPNTGQQMGESDDIINYLYNEYGDGNVPLLLKLGPLTAISNGLALLPRYKTLHLPASCLLCCTCCSKLFCMLAAASPGVVS